MFFFCGLAIGIMGVLCITASIYVYIYTVLIQYHRLLRMDISSCVSLFLCGRCLACPDSLSARA